MPRTVPGICQAVWSIKWMHIVMHNPLHKCLGGFTEEDRFIKYSTYFEWVLHEAALFIWQMVVMLDITGILNGINIVSSKTNYKSFIGFYTSLSSPQMARFGGPTWGPPGSYRLQMDPMLGPWTLLSWNAHPRRYIQNRKFYDLSLSEVYLVKSHYLIDFFT